MKKSFTLIEIMLVIAIMIMIIAGSILGIAASSKRRNAKTTAEKIKYIISEAVSQAKSPDENLFGLEKIEFDVYPHNSPNVALRNQIKAYKCFSDISPCADPNNEISKLSFIVPSGVYLDASTYGLPQASTYNHGNMKPVLYSPNQIDHYYFSFSANGTDIGQLRDCDTCTQSPPDDSQHVALKIMVQPNMQPMYIVRAYSFSSVVISPQIGT